MMKTSRSTTCSTDKFPHEQPLPEQSNPLFTIEQLQWVTDIKLPSRLFLMSATESDDQFLNLAHNEWRYRFSGGGKSDPFR